MKKRFNNLTLCLWLFFSLKGLSSNQSSSLSSTSSTLSTASSRSTLSIAKVVNPLGTVTTITESSRENILAANEFSEEYSSGAYIHENCDEAMFRPYVAVYSGTIDGEGDAMHEKPEPIGQKLIVPVIDGTNLPRDREKTRALDCERQQAENVAKFEQLSLLNRRKENVVEIDTKNKIDKNKSIKDKDKDDKKKNEVAKEVKISSLMQTENKSKKLPTKNRDNENVEIECSPSIDVSSTITDEKCDDETEVVTIKLKKKSNKNALKSIETSKEADDLKTSSKSEKSRKNSTEKSVSEAIKIDKSYEVVTEKPIVPDTLKSGKSRKKSIAEGEKSKESSIEKELSPTPEESTKSRKKKQKKIDKMLADSLAEMTSSSDDARSETIKAKKNPKKSIDDSSPETVIEPQFTHTECSDDFGLLDEIQNVDSAQCIKIQESLLKSYDTVTVARKEFAQEENEFVEIAETSNSSSAKSNKKKKSSKDSIDAEPIVSMSPKATPDEITEFTYPEPSEPMADLDSLSFKSTTDDPISLINLDSHPQEMESERMYEKYDKLSDDAECGGDAQFSDCKSFQLVIDEPESYVKTSDTNSSDETEDSSQSKSTKSSDKTIDDDDEELQPLIRSTSQSDTAVGVDLSRTDTLPDRINQSDSMQPQLETEQIQQQQQQPQKQQNNKKKFRKKRR